MRVFVEMYNAHCIVKVLTHLPWNDLLVLQASIVLPFPVEQSALEWLLRQPPDGDRPYCLDRAHARILLYAQCARAHLVCDVARYFPERAVWWTTVTHNSLGMSK